jgi:hypothetical protein
MIVQAGQMECRIAVVFLLVHNPGTRQLGQQYAHRTAKWTGYGTDPHVFGPPGSGFVIILYGFGSGSFRQPAKKVRKIFLVFCDFFVSIGKTVFWLKLFSALFTKIKFTFLKLL